jgi:hypothetical protein
MIAEVVAGGVGAEAGHGLRRVFETHVDMKPVQNEGRLLQHLPLQRP